MPAPAVISVRLDTSGAKADLARLREDAGRGVTLPGRGVGGPYGPAGAGGGGVGGGGFNLAPILGRLLSLAPLAMAGAPLARDIGTLGGTVLGGAGQALSGLFGFDEKAAGARGRQDATTETAQMFGLARGLGFVDRAQTDAFRHQIEPFREAAAKGAASILREGGIENAETTLKEIKDVLGQILLALVAVKGVRGLLGI